MARDKKNRRLNAQSLPDPGPDDHHVSPEVDETIPDGGRSETEFTKKDDIRSYGRVGDKTGVPNERVEKEYVDDEPLTRFGRMRMVRNKMSVSRKKFKFQPIKEELRLKEIRRRTKTLRGEKIIHASKMENKEVQIEDEK